jgi:hypothetical protein
MNEDYLWDRSGEPDPEVERLERVLGKYRYQPTAVSPALQSQLSQRSIGWTRLAAIAAAILIVLAGLWIFSVQNRAVRTGPTQAQNEHPGTDPSGAQNNLLPGKEQKQPVIQQSPEREQDHHVVAVANKTSRKVHSKSPVETVKDGNSEDDTNLVAERMPLMNPFVDAETARHIERAQVLLRSFRNTRDEGKQIDPEISYEKQQSRGLLYKNVLLRRQAEAKGNMPVEELLGGLEPFLLDIANLPDKPSNEEVRSIKQRMQKKEVISELQIYSAPTLSRVF